MGSVHTVRSKIWVEFTMNRIEVDRFSDLATAEIRMLCTPIFVDIQEHEPVAEELPIIIVVGGDVVVGL